MAKSNGLGALLFVDGYDISGDANMVGPIASPLTPLTLTDITQSAQERCAGKADGNMTFLTYQNTTTARSFAALSTLPRTDRGMSFFHQSTIGNVAASMVCKQIGYDPNRDADGNLLMTTAGQANRYGLEWGKMATAGKRTDTTATNGASLDGGAATSFGLAAYLHVFSVVGTSVTVKIQSSSDNGAGDAFADVTGGSFTAVLGGATSFQRIATANNLAIERYLRVVTTGTFTSAVFAVNIVRNNVTPVLS